jgi:diguanylate cyclase (GGDEF)-like protein
MAMFDMLTGLPNRALLTDRLDLALAQAERGGEMAAVLYLGLDGFKIINDNNGHETGDAVLKEVGRRIEKSIRKVDTAARMGGDEFVVVLRAVKRHMDVDATALRIIASLNEPFHVLGRAYNVGVSIGVSLSPVHSTDRDELIRMADHAMYKVKEMGKNSFRYYDPFEEAAETA